MFRQVSSHVGGLDLISHPADPALVVHLPGGVKVQRWSGEQRWDEYRRAFGARALQFWRWQERTADALWDMALRLPPWPPQSFRQLTRLAGLGVSWLSEDWRLRLSPALIWDAFRPLSDHLRGQGDDLGTFVDAQLLISAQAVSRRANALYEAAALDLRLPWLWGAYAWLICLQEI